MGIAKNIRNLYTPRQPTLNGSDYPASYSEIAPQAELLPFIYCYWNLKTKAPLDQPFTYRVVTDGCIDMFFELKKPEQNFVMGFCKKYTEFALEDSFHYVGIRFLPTIIPQVYHIDASTISNKFLHLKSVLPNISDFISTNFKTGMSEENIISTLNTYFLDTLKDAKFDEDSRLYNAIDIILSNYGVVNIEEHINTGISHRQLRRLFNYYIGATPKSFSKVVQFQNILKAKPSSQSLRRNKLFYDSGYYDQAHFIKDFKNFYGVTPTKAFGRE